MPDSPDTPDTPAPDTTGTPAPAASQPPQPITIRHDAIWGCHASVTDEQLAKIARHLDASDDELYLNEKTAARLHAPGLHFIVFDGYSGDDLRKTFAKSHSPLAMSPEIVETPPPYQPPVLQFLSLGKPKRSIQKIPPDHYQNTFRITSADIPELIRLYKDPEITVAECMDDSSVTWSRIHAQRALAELRAPGMARLLLDEILTNGEDCLDYIIVDDAIELLIQLGEEAFTLVSAELHANNTSAGMKSALAELLGNLGKRHPHLRDACLDSVRKQLENHPFNDPEYNGFLVGSLLKLNAVEAAPLLEQAHIEGNVDEEFYGDWEDVQIGLGLKKKRDTKKTGLQKRYGPAFHIKSAGDFDIDDSTDDNDSDDDLDDEDFEDEDNFDDYEEEEDEEDSDISDTEGTPYYAGSAPQSPIRNATPKIGRNDPCPCGSGKKYKKCCLDKT